MSDGQDKDHKHDVRIHIDQEPYRSPDPTTGEALYKLGNVAHGHDLYREIDGDHEDEEVPNNSDRVHLKEDEHFHSGPKEISIFVNTRKKEVKTKKVSFDQIVALAFDPVPTGPDIYFTITYKNGPKKNPEGELLQGNKVRVKDKMRFDVTATDKS